MDSGRDNGCPTKEHRKINGQPVKVYHRKKYTYDLNDFGWGAIAYGLLCGIPFLFLYAFISDGDLAKFSSGTAKSDEMFTVYFVLFNLISFLGLVITGIFIIFKRRRYLLLLLLPLSFIGLASFPFGTAYYFGALIIFWDNRDQFFPFDIWYSIIEENNKH